VVLQAVDSTVDLCAVLATRGWVVTRHVDLESFRGTGNAAEQAVGIVVIDDRAPFSASDLGELLAIDRGEWLAVVARGRANEPAMGRMLANGFYDFHTLPLDLTRLEVVMGHLHGRQVLRRQFGGGGNHAAAWSALIGRSPAMLALQRALEKVARVDAPVLITGESGAGKEAAARAIHEQSERRHGAFLMLACAGGAAAGAAAVFGAAPHAATPGAAARLSTAGGGTLYLDEIDTLPLVAQGVLLRLLEDRTVVVPGTAQILHLDTRVVAATHVDLAAEVRNGRFREDLYYRLNVLHVQVPPLRERGDDALLLAEQVFARQAAHTAPSVRGFTAEARAALAAHDWPGNVRELMSRVLQATVTCEGPLITPQDLGFAPVRAPSEVSSLEQARSIADRDLIVAALERNRQNMAATARELGISRVTLYRLVHKLAIDRSRLRQGGRGGLAFGSRPGGGLRPVEQGGAS
jgi:DNA-binding NtrC family response regulator